MISKSMQLKYENYRFNKKEAIDLNVKASTKKKIIEKAVELVSKTKYY